MWFWILPAALAAETLAPTRVQDPIEVDGVLDESAWEAVPWVEGFTSFRPIAGQPDPRARARIAYDEDALYVAFDVEKLDGTPLIQTLVPRDDTLFHDWVGVTLDTYGDAQRAAVFRSTPSGVQADGIFIEGEHIWMHSLSWDAVFQSAGVTHEDGYTVEMAIPFRSLRYGEAESQQWGIILSHFTPKPWTVNAWPLLSRETAGILQQAATLGPITPPPPRRNLELQPTLVGSGDLTEGAWSADPGFSGRVGLTSALTVDFALNPDFSQIEADAQKVEANVKYPLFYEEKRPFFLEGADLYDTPINMFYSRSVADPLVGYKMTGRQGGWAFGGLGSWDLSPAPSSIFMDYATGEALPGWGEETVEGRQSLVHVVRTRRELDRGRSIGGMVSDKELLGDDPLGNRVGALDGAMQVGEQVRIYAQGLASQTDTEDGESLTGSAWSVQVERTAEQMSLSLEQFGVTPGFRTENGYLKDVGRMGGMADLEFQLTEVGPLRLLGPGLQTTALVDMDGALVEASAGPKLEAMIGDRAYTRMRASAEKETFFGEEFDLWRFRGFLAVDPTPFTDLNLSWRVGPQPHYDAETLDDLYRGFGWRGSVSLSQSLLDRMSAEYMLVAERFGKEATSEAVYTTLLHRLHANLNLSRELGVRWITDWDTWGESLESSALLSYQVNHGTAFYVGGAITQDLAGSDPLGASVFAKLSWLYQP